VSFVTVRAHTGSLLAFVAVILAGLTGGIGSGKSTVSALFAELGAQVIDADAITREVQAPGQPVLDAMVDRFGPEILQPDGTLDRQQVADLDFSDPASLADLNAIVHPAVGREIARRLEEVQGTDDVVLLDVPLLVESGRDDLAALIVVDLDPEVAVERLVRFRGFREADARARMARQVERSERLAKADRVIHNHGSVDDLRGQVRDAYAWLRSLGT
jgi:dephospho-CoA kinase